MKENVCATRVMRRGECQHITGMVT
jgi:hypothetical protein